MAVVALGASISAPWTAEPRSAAFPAAGLQRVSLGQGMAEVTGCSDSAPLFRSHMPRLVGWEQEASKAPLALPAEDVETEEVPPAMHQALHLCVVEKFQPQRPFNGASKALYRL